MKRSIAADALLTHYGLAARLERLPGELDTNFLAVTEDRRWVFKIMRPTGTVERVELQCAILRHLAGFECGVRWPRVVPTRGGELYSEIEADGRSRPIWLLDYCPGVLLADYRPHTEALLSSLGTTLGRTTRALHGFEHPAMHADHPWLITRAGEARRFVDDIEGPTRKLAARTLERFDRSIRPQLDPLPHSVIHNDANDYNVLVNAGADGVPIADGLFDFGDAAYQPTVCEVAIAMAYAALAKPHPLAACAAVLAAYDAVSPLVDSELRVVFDLVRTRLAVSIAISSHRVKDDPDNAYTAISQRPARRTLAQLAEITPELAEAYLRHGCGRPVTPGAAAVGRFLEPSRPSFEPAVRCGGSTILLDLSSGSTLLGADPRAVERRRLSAAIDSALDGAGARFAIGRYGESRPIYASPDFADAEAAGRARPTDETRTHHLGVDVFCVAGTPVYAPLDGRVAAIGNNDRRLDFGPFLLLEHATETGEHFYSLYAHLDAGSLNPLRRGLAISAGQPIATVGAPPENGDWPPHLHLQLILDTLKLGADFPGVALERDAAFWRALCPNPGALLGIDDPDSIDGAADPERLLKLRHRHLGGNLRLSYSTPVHVVRGYRQYLYDSRAYTYLDVYNNVPHVGHSHPRVVEAVRRQYALLNTNTRYLNSNIVRYAERLAAKMPEELSVCFFVNSGSEANELALRLARTYTGRNDFLVNAGAYHGHTSRLIELSPYKHGGPGGAGAPDWVHEAPLPDDYRGRWKRGEGQAGARYADELAAILDAVADRGRSVAGFIAETYPSVGGQIVPPPGYLEAAYRHVRARGGLCIADEVQTGFGRLGASYWGFESQGAEPDIVVLGKPIANGFPMGAVVTTPEIAMAFDNGMEFFSTFGGNPVACAAALAVMEVVEEEGLQEHAATLGTAFLDRLRELQRSFPLIGDVRGEGLFLGLELVRDPETLEPADRETRYVVDRLRDHRILAGTDGLFHNVVKIRPPMVVESHDLELVATTLGEILAENPLRGLP